MTKTRRSAGAKSGRASGGSSERAYLNADTNYEHYESNRRISHTHTVGSGDTARLKLNKQLTKRYTTIKHLCVISRLLVLATTKDKSARTDYTDDCDDNYSACQSLGKGEIRRDLF